MKTLKDYNLEPPKGYDLSPREVECSECDGRGRRWVACGYRRCEACNGSGYVEPELDDYPDNIPPFSEEGVQGGW